MGAGKTVGDLVAAGLAEVGMKLRFEGEDEIVEVVLSGWCLLDSKGRVHTRGEIAVPIIEPVPNVE